MTQTLIPKAQLDSTLVDTTSTQTLTNKTLTSPTLTTPVLGTPTSGTLTNCTFPTLNQNTTGSAGSVAFSGVTAATNANALVIGTGGSLTTSGTGTITATAVPASGLTGTTLASGVVTSSLTTVGTIGTGTWQGSAIGPTYGGTNQTSYTTGDILYASASNTLSRLAIGSTGNVLTVASGVPSWGSAGSSEVVLLGTATASTSASLAFTSLITSSYDYYFWVIKDLIPATNSATLRLRVSTNNGTSYISTANYNYTNVNTSVSATSQTVTGNSGSGYIPLTSAGIGTSSAGWNGSVYSINPLSTVQNAFFNGEVLYTTGGAGGSSNSDQVIANYVPSSFTAVNAVQFLASSGNLTSGKITMYGVKNT